VPGVYWTMVAPAPAHVHAHEYSCTRVADAHEVSFFLLAGVSVRAKGHIMSSGKEHCLEWLRSSTLRQQMQLICSIQ